MMIGKILIIHQGAIGDFILSLPAIEGIRKHFQHHTCAFMGYPPILELMVGDREQVTTIDLPGFSSLYTVDPDPPEELREYFRQFGKVFIFGVKGEDVLVRGMKMIGIKDVFRIDTFPGQGIHVLDYQASVLSALGIEVKCRVPHLSIREEDELLAGEFLLRHGVGEDEPLIFIHPGSGSEKKVWHLSSFTRLARRLKDALSARIVLITGPAERMQSKKIYTLMNDVSALTIESLPLRILAALVKRGKCFIGNDSGITHLSAAVGTPLVALFGPTNPAVWAPRGVNVRIVSGKADCSPCNPEILNGCTRQICLENISIEAVYCAVEKMISGRSGTLYRAECRIQVAE